MTMRGIERVSADIKTYLKIRLLYPRQFPSCSIDSLLPPSVAVGRGVIIRGNVSVTASLRTIDRYAYIGEGTAILACARIGAFSCISQACRVGLENHALGHLGTSHLFSNPGRGWVTADTRETPSQVEIGADVLLSAGALILAGVRIGHGAVVGAGAVVTKDVPPYALVVGVPARVKGYRFEEPLRSQLLESRWWTWDDADIRALSEHFPHPMKFLEAARVRRGEHQLTT